jgi:sulfite reductase beta subunit-like hemoprotein
MKNIRDIMAICKVDEQTARRIFDIMACSGLDFSECTKAEFKRAALAAQDELKVRKWQKYEIGSN